MAAPESARASKRTMRNALSDPNLLGKVIEGETWRPWRILLIAIMGEELDDEERVVFKDLTCREHEPGAPVEEFWAVVGRRGGKSRAIATLLVYLALLRDHTDKLVTGERPVALCLAQTAKQATVVLNYCRRIIEGNKLFAGEISNRTAEVLSLKNGVDIEVRPASFRGVRGVTAIAVVADEIAFWRSDESANPDKEILQALRPSLATTGGLLCAISSPHAKRGELYATFKRHFGTDGHPLILVAKASSRTMNPSLPQRVVDRAMEEDPASAAAEYMAEFRGDLEIFVDREILEGCVTRGVAVRPPLPDLSYFGFVDPSGGSSDSMTMAVAHNESGRVVLDCIGERKAPFSPDSVVSEFAETLRSYRISTVTGDRYAGEWPRERFAAYGVTYRVADLNRSELYLAFLPLVNSGRCDLLDSSRMVAQFAGLERRTSRAGKDSVDHSPGAHDDIANAVAGVASLASVVQQTIRFVAPFYASQPSAFRDFDYGGTAGIGADSWSNRTPFSGAR
jgi:hypothetical protein